MVFGKGSACRVRRVFAVFCGALEGLWAAHAESLLVSGVIFVGRASSFGPF